MAPCLCYYYSLQGSMLFFKGGGQKELLKRAILSVRPAMHASKLSKHLHINITNSWVVVLCFICSLNVANWERNKRSGSIPQLKGARRFTFEEIKKCTHNFSEANEVGSGGYGKVKSDPVFTRELISQGYGKYYCRWHTCA